MNIRLEQPKDYREVENLTRESFWNVYRPGCMEHYVLNQYRTNPDFIPELDFVMDEDGKIIGHMMFSKAEITLDDGTTYPSWTFGPISIHPDYKRKGYGLKLLLYAIEKAKEMGIGLLQMEGNIEFYKHAGFDLASKMKIHYHAEPRESEVPYFLAQEVIPGYWGNREGTYCPPKGYFVADENPDAFEVYEATFPQKKKSFNEGQLPQFCQSCGMPLMRIEDCGTNADGSTNFDYCQYCNADGKSNGNNMKHEIIELHDVQIIGIAKKIAFNEAKEECPKFWGEYVEKIIKPVIFEKQAPNILQKAAFDNGIGEFGLCTCDIPNHNCATCWEANFEACGKNTFTYVIGGIYKGGDVPEDMQLFPIHSGKWLKMHFEGGMKAFQEQYIKFHKEWLPAHPEYKWARNSCCLEWYQGTDIQSPDYQCGVMMPLEEQPRFTFDTVGLFTTDNKATVDFYTKAFGFTTSWDGVQPNVEMFLGNNRIILFPRSAFEQMVSKKFQYPAGFNGTMELSFDVPTFADVDKEYQNALNNGAKSVLSPTTEPWGQRTCYVADPDGNLIEIGSFVE